MESGITQKEMDILKLLEKGNSLSEACNSLGIEKPVGSNRLRRLKDRYLKAREFCEDYERHRGKLPGKYL